MFHREDPALILDAVVQRSIKAPFSPSNFNGFEMRLIAEDLILIDKEQHKKIFQPRTTAVSERPTQPPVLMSIRRLAHKL